MNTTNHTESTIADALVNAEYNKSQARAKQTYQRLLAAGYPKEVLDNYLDEVDDDITTFENNLYASSDEELLDGYYDCWEVDSKVQYYIDEEKLLEDLQYDYYCIEGEYNNYYFYY